MFKVHTPDSCQILYKLDQLYRFTNLQKIQWAKGRVKSCGRIHHNPDLRKLQKISFVFLLMILVISSGKMFEYIASANLWRNASKSECHGIPSPTFTKCIVLKFNP